MRAWLRGIVQESGWCLGCAQNTTAVGMPAHCVGPFPSVGPSFPFCEMGGGDLYPWADCLTSFQHQGTWVLGSSSTPGVNNRYNILPGGGRITPGPFPTAVTEAGPTIPLFKEEPNPRRKKGSRLGSPKTAWGGEMEAPTGGVPGRGGPRPVIQGKLSSIVSTQLKKNPDRICWGR